MSRRFAEERRRGRRDVQRIYAERHRNRHGFVARSEDVARDAGPAHICEQLPDGEIEDIAGAVEPGSIAVGNGHAGTQVQHDAQPNALLRQAPQL